MTDGDHTGAAIRVVLPAHLKRLANVDGEVSLPVDASGPDGAPTIGDVLEAIESTYPVLRGTIRDHTTRKRRDFVRFFACEEDLSHEPVDMPLPQPVVVGREPFLVVGAMAGG